MAKKIRFESLSSPFTLVGIASHLKDYRLGFFMNQRLGFHLKRKDDLVIHGEPTKAYSFFMFSDKDERKNYFLIGNHHPDGKLLPGQKGLDFILFVDDLLTPVKATELTRKIQSVPQVLTAYPLDTSKIKNLGALLEDIEMHVMQLTTNN